MVQFGTTVCAAVAMKPNLLNVPKIVLQCLTVTVTMGKMQEWSVQVSEVASGVRCVLRGRKKWSE